ncbi:MAG: hypothetical protein H0X03_05100 [Nitrosopumilus sp.]|nr:hypothetical protein [Nitrosopumilus sp.]
MSFGVDTLGGLIEKLKQLTTDTQDQYESFFDSTQLFKQGKIDNKEYFLKMGEFLVSSSALNFLACRIILEIKTVLDKGISKKSSMGGSSSSPSTLPSGFGGGSGGSGGFGVDSFVTPGGTAGSLNKGYDLSKSQESPSFKPVDIVISKQDSNMNKEQKNCIVCAASIPKHAKFCSKCGNSQ